MQLQESKIECRKMGGFFSPQIYLVDEYQIVDTETYESSWTNIAK